MISGIHTTIKFFQVDKFKRPVWFRSTVIAQVVVSKPLVNILREANINVLSFQTCYGISVVHCW